MEQENFGFGWYALQVRPKQEDIVSTLLEQKDYSTYAPTYKAVIERRGRIEVVPRKLFPGYVFCQFAPGQGVRVGTGAGVVTTPGVIRILGVGNTPIAVPNIEIESIQRVLASDLISEPWSYLRVGQSVEIEHGPLKGLRGLLLSISNVDRFIVSVELLQRSVAVQIPRDWIQSSSPFSNGPSSAGFRWETLADHISAGSAAA